jgi:hypothetical protein
MEAAFQKHLEDEASKPKVEEKRYSKEEISKRYDILPPFGNIRCFRFVK